MEKNSVCIVTGSRSEYGLLKPVMLKIREYYNLILVVTGSHLLEKFGNTYLEIEKEFTINEKIYMDLHDNTDKNITTEMSKELLQFSNIFSKYKIDLLMVLGDRYEILIPVICATIYKIPIAHLCGGDITEGAYDDNIRHAISKMSHLHFVTNDRACNILAQMGENKCRIFNVGNPGLNEVAFFVPYEKKLVEQQLGIQFNEKNIVVIYHPVTLEDENSKIELINLLNALDIIQNKCNIYFIGSNADTDTNFIYEKIINFCKGENRYCIKSLTRNLYLNLLYYSDILVGNSSSGIYEEPLLKKYTINIGNRQKGRLTCSSVINCSGLDKNDLIKKISEYIKKEFIDIIDYPYDIKDTPNEIIKVIKSVNLKSLINKKFMLFDNY